VIDDVELVEVMTKFSKKMAFDVKIAHRFDAAVGEEYR